jgi:aerobic-type carbon monoxide dehydrogenase small subunit (CoxS/CutS family)
MSERINFTINGTQRTIEAEDDMTLLDAIRDVLDLTGTKRGCDNATCGTCVVVVNGKAVKSCNYPIAKAQGAVILTVEGLSKGKELHPVQRAIVDSGAVQCGYCIPGITMELVALLEEKPGASEQEMVNALNKHLCRCNGYEPIMNAARVAQQLVNEQT